MGVARQPERLSCPRCGANNFEGVQACWKCGAPLVSAAPAPATQVGAAHSGVPDLMPYPRGAAVAAATRDHMEFSAAPRGAADPPGDQAVATRAAILLALVIPWVGLPAGWIIMMIGDGRRQAVGRICVVWSTVSMVVQSLLMFALAEPLVGYVRQVLPAIVQTMSKGGGGYGADNAGYSDSPGAPVRPGSGGRSPDLNRH